MAIGFATHYRSVFVGVFVCPTYHLCLLAEEGSGEGTFRPPARTQIDLIAAKTPLAAHIV